MANSLENLFGELRRLMRTRGDELEGREYNLGGIKRNYCWSLTISSSWKKREEHLVFIDLEKA